MEPLKHLPSASVHDEKTRLCTVVPQRPPPPRRPARAGLRRAAGALPKARPDATSAVGHADAGRGREGYVHLAYMQALYGVFRDQMGPAAQTLFEWEVRALADSPATLEVHCWSALIMGLSRCFTDERTQARFLFKADELTPRHVRGGVR